MAYLLALASAALYGGADFIGGLAARRAATMPIVLVSQTSGLAVLTALLLLAGADPPSARDLWWGALAGLSGGVGVGLLYRALAIGVMAVVAPITAVCAVLIPVGAELAGGHRPGVVTSAGMLLALAAIVLVSQSAVPVRAAAGSSARGTTDRAPLALAVFSGVLIGGFFLALARTGDAAGLWPLVAARAAAAVVFAAGLLAAKGSRLPWTVARWAVAAGIVDTTANALYILASRRGTLSVVVTLASLYPASTVVLARLVVRERLNHVQAAGIACAMAAVALIVGGG